MNEKYITKSKQKTRFFVFFDLDFFLRTLVIVFNGSQLLL